MMCFLIHVDAPGTLHDTGKVIVELGTGYFAEKTTEEAKELIDRKVSELFNCLLM